MKKMYNTPKTETQPMLSDTSLMLLGSPTAPQPAPKRTGETIE
jgi:hypothetical protein